MDSLQLIFNKVLELGEIVSSLVARMNRSETDIQNNFESIGELERTTGNHTERIASLEKTRDNYTDVVKGRRINRSANIIAIISVCIAAASMAGMILLALHSGTVK